MIEFEVGHQVRGKGAKIHTGKISLLFLSIFILLLEIFGFVFISKKIVTVGCKGNWTAKFV